jgi:Na+/proline symporter
MKENPEKLKEEKYLDGIFFWAIMIGPFFFPLSIYLFWQHFKKTKEFKAKWKIK